MKSTENEPINNHIKKGLDNVMGGESVGQIDRYEDHIHFTGQLDLINGGFATFTADVGLNMDYEGNISIFSSFEYQYGLSISC